MFGQILEVLGKTLEGRTGGRGTMMDPSFVCLLVLLFLRAESGAKQSISPLQLSCYFGSEGNLLPFDWEQKVRNGVKLNGTKFKSSSEATTV